MKLKRKIKLHQPVVCSGGEDGRCWSCDALDVLLDVKFFLKEYYPAFFEDDGKSLIVKFNNGQKFKITAEEM